MKGLFAGRIRSLIDGGDEVKKCEAKHDDLAREYEQVRKMAKMPQRNWEDLPEMERRCRVELDLVESRIKEFRSGMKCLLAHVEGKELKEYGEEGLKLCKLDENQNRDWSRTQKLMMRECRKLEEVVRFQLHLPMMKPCLKKGIL